MNNIHTMPRRKRTVKGGRMRPPDKQQVVRLIDPPTTKKTTQLKGDALIRATYEDPRYGLMSAGKLHKNLKLIDPKITLKQVKDVLAKQESVQINSEKRRPGYSKIVAPDVGVSWQADLIDLSRYKGVNKQYRYILSVIDIFSRYGLMIPLKDKTGATMARAFTELLDGKLTPDNKAVMKNITTDDGSEFLAKQVQAVFNKHDVKHWRHPPGDKHPTGMIERFNRTVRTMLRKWWSMRDTKKWVDVIGALQDNYNNSVHRSIGARPHDVWVGKALPKVPKQVQVEVFVAGDKVRKQVKHTAFDKKTERWSRDVYEVVRADGRGYILKNLSSGHELATRTKPDAMLKVGDVEVAENKRGDSHVAAAQIREQRIDRRLKKAGVERNESKAPRQRRTKKVPGKFKDFQL